MADPQPEIRIIAGPNGAGKTTFARDFLPRYASVQRFVNADLIAAGLSPFAPEAAALAAGRLVLAEIRRHVEQRLDFAFETTLSGKSYAPMLEAFRARGYRVYLYFLWLPEIAMTLRRITERVSKGGHQVPEKDVRRRYARGIANFFQIYRPLTDSWIVYDNSGSWPREIAFARADVPTILDEEAYRKFQEAANTR